MPNHQPRMTQRGHFFLSTKILFARPSRFYGEGHEQQSAADFPLHNGRLMANCQVFVLAAVNKGHATWMLKIKSCCYANEDEFPAKKEQWKHKKYRHAQDSRIVRIPDPAHYSHDAWDTFRIPGSIPKPTTRKSEQTITNCNVYVV